MAAAAKFLITLGLDMDGMGTCEEFIISCPLQEVRMDKKKQNINLFMECYKLDGAKSFRPGCQRYNELVSNNPLWTRLHGGFLR
ncbi:MAG TPA: hypothetical protein PKM27_13455 [Saprospiraceae bacterium]|nr:hypothetical protein [Saprospiraceae bacterium]HNT19769.1 hypothetical protein [Saprospiraceae bacterium]